MSLKKCFLVLGLIFLIKGKIKEDNVLIVYNDNVKSLSTMQRYFSFNGYKKLFRKKYKWKSLFLLWF